MNLLITSFVIFPGSHIDTASGSTPERIAKYNCSGLRAYHVALASFESVAKRLSPDMSDLWVEDAMTFPRQSAQGNGSDAGLITHMQAQFVTMGPASTTNPAMLKFVPYNPATVGLTFSPHTGAEVFSSYFSTQVDDHNKDARGPLCGAV